MTDRELMQQAIDAIAGADDFIFDYCDCEPNNELGMGRYAKVRAKNHSAFNALRERLAQPEQEPMAWEDVLGAIARGWTHDDNKHKPMDVQLAVAIAKEIQDMVAAPPQRTWVGSGDLEDSNAYLTPPQRKPDYKEFMEWASSKGYDTAYAINSDNGKYIPLNPMTADLWKAWQAAHGIKGEA